VISDVMIQSFLTLAKTLNFTNAAKELYLSQQAVSKHISRLEEDLECQLFIRERGNIQLTQAGDIYLEVFQRYKEGMDAANALVRKLNKAEDKKVKVGYIDLLNITPVFYPILGDYKKEHPEIHFEYRSAPDWQLPILMKDDKVDIAISFSSEFEVTEEMESIVIATAREILFVSKEHPLAKEDASYMDFKDETVFFSLPPGGNIDVLLKRMEDYQFPFDNLVITENILSSCTAIEMGQGVSFAIEPCKLIDDKVYATYPTNRKVDIILVAKKDSENPMVHEIMELARKYVENSKQV
jgi:DNA-binding transcriptional LysR family regulator